MKKIEKKKKQSAPAPEKDKKKDIVQMKLFNPASMEQAKNYNFHIAEGGPINV